MAKGSWIKWSILTALAVYCVGMCAWARGEASRRVCEGIDIQIRGNNHAMDSMIRRGITSELAHYPHKLVGSRISEIDTGDLERYLVGISNFESVSCMLSSGGRLRIEIEPLVPVMRVFFGDNSYYINKEGKHIESKAEFYTPAPVVTGSFSSAFPPKTLIPLVRHIEQDNVLRELVSMVEARDPNNLILVPRMMGHVVNFGDTSRLDEKTRALSLFYRKVMPYKGWEEYDTISVKFRGQVVATRRVKPRVNVTALDPDEIDPDEATLSDHLPANAAIKAEEPPVVQTEE